MQTAKQTFCMYIQTFVRVKSMDIMGAVSLYELGI